MNPPERRSVSLAGLGLIGAGAVLGLSLAVPASGASTEPVRPARTESAAVVEQDHPDS